MHPGFIQWWKRHGHRFGCDSHVSCSPWGGAASDSESGARFSEPDGFDGGASAFGVRRPLRFLAYKLELSEAQVTALAAILNQLKTERAQASVDYRRTTATLAELLTAEQFDSAKAEEAGAERVRSAERTRSAVLEALRKIHALLTPEQRRKLAYLLQTGALAI